MTQSRTPDARQHPGDEDRKRQRLADHAALESARKLPHLWSDVALKEAEDTSGSSSESWRDTRRPGEDELRAILKGWQLKNLDWNGHDIFKVALDGLLEERTAGRVHPQNIGIMSTLVGQLMCLVADTIAKIHCRESPQPLRQKDRQKPVDSTGGSDQPQTISRLDASWQEQCREQQESSPESDTLEDQHESPQERQNDETRREIDADWERRQIVWEWGYRAPGEAERVMRQEAASGREILDHRRQSPETEEDYHSEIWHEWRVDAPREW